MKEEIINPVVGNFVKSLRDIGYVFEVAVADVLDNSITAKAENISILLLEEPLLTFSILDDGIGMNEKELINAMRLATHDPDRIREEYDLGKFGLGLKTASFSQCTKLTVLSKSNEEISIKQWDLEYISKKNEWLLVTPSLDIYANHPLFKNFYNQQSGTLVIWEKIDTFKPEDTAHHINELRDHLALVFHHFLEGKVPKRKKLNININGLEVKAFNPFNPTHRATQEFPEEKIFFNNYEINIQPYILPHHSKLSQTEFERYATSEGYTKSQGFYLYRGYRLLIYGTWWGLHKINDTHRLVRIKIEIPTNRDSDWGIDIKKSTARPVAGLKKDLKRIIQQVTAKGSKPFTGRGKRMTNNKLIHLWDQVADNDQIKFVINDKHPILQQLEIEMNEQQKILLKVLVKSLESYLPIDTIVAQIHANPHKVKQEVSVEISDLELIVNNLKMSGLSDELIYELLNTEIFSGENARLLKRDK